MTNLISESSWPSWLSRVIQFQSHLLTQQILNSLILDEASDFDSSVEEIACLSPTDVVSLSSPKDCKSKLLTNNE